MSLPKLKEQPEPISDPMDDTDYEFMDSLLEGWAKWAAPGAGPQPPTAAGVVLRIASVRDGEYQLRISDDEFTLVDSRIAILITRLRQIVELEYRGLWNHRYWLLTQENKWRRIGIGRKAYVKRLAQAQRTLFTSLKPSVFQWLGRRRGSKKS